MNLTKPIHLTITPTYVAVLEKYSADEVDIVLRKSFPDAFEIEESSNFKKSLLERIQSFKPHQTTLGVDEALRQTREEDFLQ